MNDRGDILSQVRTAAGKRILFLPHALRQMMRPDRMISRLEIRNALFKGEVIEDYPEDPRGHSCLIFGVSDLGRALHVVCAPKEDYLAIITAYLPDEGEWTDNFTVRIES